jgi:hypothetical protein
MRRSIVGNGEDLRSRHAEHPPSVQRTEKECKNENTNEKMRIMIIKTRDTQQMDTL